MENLIERNSEELKIDNYIRICHRGGGSERLNVERSKFGTLYQTKSMNIQRNPLREIITIRMYGLKQTPVLNFM